MRGVTACHLLNSLEQPYRVRGESAKGIESEQDEHVLILDTSFFVLSYFVRLVIAWPATNPWSLSSTRRDTPVKSTHACFPHSHPRTL
ncbi:hypothetical protein Hanom_Chr14g01252281 [Helianthus anomalus]